MQASIRGTQADAAELRRQFGERFAHEFQLMPNRAGLVETQKFLGRDSKDEDAWEKVEASLRKDPSGFLGGPFTLAAGTAMEDLNPPPTFLASLDAPADGFSTDASVFLGSGGIEHPSALSSKLNNDLSSTGPASALLLERHLVLRPQESRTVCFMYGYAPQGFEIDALVAKYKQEPEQWWSPVSYTHLDVYKRQLQRIARRPLKSHDVLVDVALRKNVLAKEAVISQVAAEVVIVPGSFSFHPRLAGSTKSNAVCFPCCAGPRPPLLWLLPVFCLSLIHI